MTVIHRVVPAALALLLNGCVCSRWAHDKVVAPVDVASLDPAKEGILLTMGDLPADRYTPVAMVHAEHYGLYLVWIVPVVSAKLKKVLDERIAAEAKARGADAVIDIRLSYDTEPPFPLSLVLLGTVVKSVTADGMAVKLKPSVASAP